MPGRENVDIIIRNGPSIDAAWPDIADEIDALEVRGIDSMEVFSKLRRRTAILFLVYVEGTYMASAVAELEITTKRRSLYVMMMTGRHMSKWLPELIDALKDYADRVGAEEISCLARRGLAKQLREMKWTYGTTEMVLPVNGVSHGRKEQQTEDRTRAA